MGQGVAVLVNRAALNWYLFTPEGDECGLKTRRTINDDQLGLLQATGIQILDELAPRRSALPSHVADGQKNLLPIMPHTDGGQHRDGDGLLIQPSLDDRAVQDEAHDVLICQATAAPCLPVSLHLAPGTAHRALADGSFEQ